VRRPGATHSRHSRQRRRRRNAYIRSRNRLNPHRCIVGTNLSTPPPPALFRRDSGVLRFGWTGSHLSWASAVTIALRRVSFGVTRWLRFLTHFCQSLHQLDHLSDDNLGDANCEKTGNRLSRFMRRLPLEAPTARIDDSSAESVALVVPSANSFLDDTRDNV
jgi:hypothetical protein